MSKGEMTALQSSRERAAATTSGYLMLLMLLILLLSIAGTVFGVIQLANENFGILSIVLVVASPLIMILVACGFYMLQPNQAAAITLFGDYKGTDRTTGLRWVWPWMMRAKVSVRANNFISERIKWDPLESTCRHASLSIL